MDYDSIKILVDLISGLHNTELAQKVEIFLIAWFFIRRTIASHFTKIELGLDHVAKTVSDLGGALTKVESTHSLRIGALESDVFELKEQIVKKIL